MVSYCALGRRRQIATLARTPKLSGFILLRIQSSASQIGFLHSTGKEPCDWRAFSRTTQLEPSFTWSDGVFAAGRSIGSLKYKHHFGLDCFSRRREHWALQALLTHSINVVSFAASGLDASAFAVRALGRTGFAVGKICCVRVTSSTGFS
jgi:hypothetical protein